MIGYQEEARGRVIISSSKFKITKIWYLCICVFGVIGYQGEQERVIISSSKFKIIKIWYFCIWCVFGVNLVCIWCDCLSRESESACHNLKFKIQNY